MARDRRMEDYFREFASRRRRAGVVADQSNRSNTLPHLGDYNIEEVDWLKAVEAYRREVRRENLTARDVLLVANRLGYRKPVVSTAPEPTISDEVVTGERGKDAPPAGLVPPSGG